MLNMEKFARALRLRWLWFEWKEPAKMWVGMGNPFTKMDYEFFYASTTIMIGNGARTPFWDAPWVQGRKPRDIAPLIFEASQRKNWKIKDALKDDAWVAKIRISPAFSITHFRQFLELWATIHGFILVDVEDGITWKHTASGCYTAASAYKAQFLGMTCSPMEHAVWKTWPL